MKKCVGNILKGKAVKRVISGFTAAVMLFEIAPFNELKGKIDTGWLKSSLTAFSEGSSDIQFEYDSETTRRVEITPEQLVDYSLDCQNFRAYHQFDNLVIIGSTEGTDTAFFTSGFESLGDEQNPFGGSVSIEGNTGIVINIDAPLFDWVYDDTEFNNENNGAALMISREYSDRTDIRKTTPLLANHVVHHGNGNANWNITICKPSDDADQEKVYKLGKFAGLIGEMEGSDTAGNGASLSIEAAFKTGDGDTADLEMNGTGNIGLVCGKMGKNTSISFTLIRDGNSDRDISLISTTSDNAGGLAGEMLEGAQLTYTGVNTQAEITTASGYAGGIVGKNTGGTVTFAASPYPISQTITGTSGAGGVYGYYEPKTDITITTDKYTVNCQVNGTGNTGGIIGKLSGTNSVTVDGSSGTTVTSSHAAGSADSYGGIIGSSSVPSLTLSNISISTSKAGAASYYGGGVGKIEYDGAYANFSGVTVSSENVGALTYGGLAASADKAFVDAIAVTINANGFKGGGLVGSLENGVLRINGTGNVLSGAVPATPADAEVTKVGKIVGYRDNGLVFLAVGASYTGSTAAVDNIGAWGDVIDLNGFASPANVLSVSGTAVTVGTSSYAFTSIASAEDYAVTALRFQLDDGENPFISFANTSLDSTGIASASIVLADSINGTAKGEKLSGTGFGGLTRDNGTKNISFSGTFTGKTGSDVHELDLSIGTVYRHKYNGLFGRTERTSGNVVSDLILGGSIDVNACVDMYAGAVAACAKNLFSVSNVTVNTAMTHAGGKSLYMGGILGEAVSDIGNITISGCTVKADMSGNASDPCLGGIIGKIAYSGSAARTWTISSTDVTGRIESSASIADNCVGGLVADMSGNSKASLNLSKVDIKGLKILVNAKSNGSVGGMLGYSWLNVNVDFDEVQVVTTVLSSVVTSSNAETVVSSTETTVAVPTVEQTNASATGVDFAGLVYNGTGYWKVQNANDIKIDAFALSSNSAQSCGMIVNKGWSESSALYLELQTVGAYSLSGSTTYPASVTDFDELVAYTAYYEGSGSSKKFYSGTNTDDLYILKNGQGIVSIQTANTGGGLIMDGSSASGTYTPTTELGKQMNPHSRYYYNLYTIKTGTSDEDKLMSWGAKWYAHETIKSSVSSNSWGSTIPAPTQPKSGQTEPDYDMQGYSWYPLNIDNASVTINGTFKLYNKEFEDSDDYTTGNHVKRTSLYNNGTTQHYLMQSALFNNVGGKLSAGTVTLQGSIPLIDTGNSKYCGFLVMGDVIGSDSVDEKTAKITTENVILDGAYIHNLASEDYAPLLINRSGQYSTLTIGGVRVKNEDSYKNNSAVTIINNIPKAATSLIGNAGKDETSQNVNVSFSNIQLDGRNENLGLTALDSIYHTDASIFTKATLLNRLSFSSGSGTYNYTYELDWTSTLTSAEGVTPETYSYSHTPANVTYGKEVGYISGYSSQYPGEENKYLNSNIYVNPTNGNDTTGTYLSTFVSSYLPYVAVPYQNTTTPYCYELEVNRKSSEFDGCGTYNDPYTLTTGDDFATISKILAGNCAGAKINLPMSGTSTADTGLTWHGTAGHKLFKCDTNNSDFYLEDNPSVTITQNEVRTYVAGAYFLVDPAENNTITLESADFKGFGSTADNFARFRGVIVGTGNETIENKTGYPLIAVSNGSVVKGIKIDVNSTRTIKQADAKSFADSTPEVANSYGAVMGTVLGGDNIIDNVKVSFLTDTSILLSGNKAQLIPVGGYVGVIEKGGVIFRGMEGQSGISGLPYDGQVVKQSGSNSTVDKYLIKKPEPDNNGGTTYVDNMKWLYVNPIVGRVINGFAVTEASAYRPFEDGTRTYGDSTVEYWAKKNSDNTVSKVSSSDYNTADYTLLPVTMQNGCKHYSIADISLSEGKLDTKGTSDYVEIPNGQAFFIMSLVVNSGMSKKALGYNNAYQVSRSAQYSGVVTNLTAAANSVSDYNLYAKNDKYGSSASRGYIWNYTINNTDISGAYSKTLELTATNGYYYLPDGYKGIGNIFQNSDYYRMKISTLIGNGATISQNSSYYYYDSGNDYYDLTGYLPNRNNPSGFGLNNYMNVSGTYENFYLTGSVKCDLVGTDGSFITSKKAIDCEQNYYLCAGMLIGTSNETPTIKNVALKNINVFGIRNTGGMIGFQQNNKTVNYEIESTVNSDAYNSDLIKVHGRSSTGGLIGKLNPGFVKTDMNGHTFNLSEVVCECKDRGGNYWDYGVGGFIGMIRKGDNNEDLTKNSFKNIVIGTAEKEQTVICEKADIFTAGVVGIMNKANGITIDNCTFYNLSVKAKFGAAGLVAFPTTATPAKVTNTHLYSPLHSEIISSTDYAGGLIGSSDPRPSIGDGSREFTFENCSVEGCTISGKKGAGGVIGFRGSWSDDVYLYLNNTSVINCTVKSDGSAGGLIGEMISPVAGYNALAKNITIAPYTENGTIQHSGYICGYVTSNSSNITYRLTGKANEITNTRTGAKPAIKLAGFSRQDDRTGDDYGMIADLVGSYPDKDNAEVTEKKPYGTGGYVVFADFRDTASSSPNNVFSAWNSTSNVLPASPFVTSSPKFDIDGTTFLTGDGAGVIDSGVSPSYNNSIIRTILEDSTNKKYTYYKRFDDGITTDILTAEDTANMISHYSSSYTEYSALYPSSVVSDMKNIPLLVVDDSSRKNASALINDYINVLANTNYNYAATDSCYTVVLNKCQYNNGKWSIVNNEAANLLIDTESGKERFYFNASNVDSNAEKPQFTLLDVQYKDPSASGSIAYHLYIPVFIKKMLRYDFKAYLDSGTNYYTGAYASKGSATLFENLGNPVTMMIEYSYQRTPSEWADAVNNGESVMTRYYKALDIKVHDTGGGNDWPSDTKFVLVDTANGDRAYYLSSDKVITEGNKKYLYFGLFKDESGADYIPAPLCASMNFKAVECMDGTLVAGETGATLVIGDTYYRPATADDTALQHYKVLAVPKSVNMKAGNANPSASDCVEVTVNETLGEAARDAAAIAAGATIYHNGKYYRPVKSTDTGQRYSVSFDSERYYLSILTKAENTQYNVIPYTGGNFVAAADASEATVETGGNYYRPAREGETGAYAVLNIPDTMIQTSTGEYVKLNTINVLDAVAAGAEVFYNNEYYRPVHDTGDEEKQRYSCEKVYHYEISSVSTFEESKTIAVNTSESVTLTASDWKPNKLASNKYIHLLIGNFYENDMKISVEPEVRGNNCMSKGNSLLRVAMTAEIALSAAATSDSVSIQKNLKNNAANSSIFQTFLMNFDMKTTENGTSEVGLAGMAEGYIVEPKFYYCLGKHLNDFSVNNATPIEINANGGAEHLTVPGSYYELRSNKNLISDISNAEGDYAVTVYVEYYFTCPYAKLSEQFPANPSESPNIGSKVIGYSNISASSENAAYSSTTIKRDDSVRYYTMDVSNASLLYDAELAPSPALFEENGDTYGFYGGDYSYLGINGIETIGNSSVIYSEAVYDTSDIENNGDYIEFRLSLSSKGDYIEPNKDNDTYGGTALDINDYIEDIKICGKDISSSEQLVLFDTKKNINSVTQTENSETVTVSSGTFTSDGKVLKLRVRKDMLRNRGEDSGIYALSVEFKVKAIAEGQTYSNYKVSLTARVYEDMGSTSFDDNSFAADHIIYTNAKVNPEVMQ